MLDKIMVVDDDPNICELLRLYLEKENFDVVIASDGRQALKKFDMEAPRPHPARYHAPRTRRLAGLPRNPQKKASAPSS